MKNNALLMLDPTTLTHIELAEKDSNLFLDYFHAEANFDGFAAIQQDPEALSGLKDQVAISILEDGGEYSDVAHELTFEDLAQATYNAELECWQLANGKQIVVYIETTIKG